MAAVEQLEQAQPVLTANPAVRVTEIRPARGWAFPNLREVWQYRGVLINMVGRNFRIQYRQTIGGPLYALYEPLMTMVGYSILLGGLAGMQTEGDLSYPVFTFSALTIWTLFTTGVKNASMSLFANSALVTKIYVPRLIFPLVSISLALVDFAITFVVLLLLMLVEGIIPTAGVIWLPLFTLLTLMLATGIGLWFAALHARFRDTNYAVGLITRGLFFLTPVVYSSKVLPAPWDQIYYWNPMAVVVEGFRWALLGEGSAPQPERVLLAGALAIIILITGAFTFRRLEMNIADVV